MSVDFDYSAHLSKAVFIIFIFFMHWAKNLHCSHACIYQIFSFIPIYILKEGFVRVSFA